MRCNDNRSLVLKEQLIKLGFPIYSICGGAGHCTCEAPDADAFCVFDDDIDSALIQAVYEVADPVLVVAKDNGYVRISTVDYTLFDRMSLEAFRAHCRTRNQYFFAMMTKVLEALELDLGVS